MKVFTKTLISLTISTISLSAYSQLKAEDVLKQDPTKIYEARCAKDNLDKAQARARINFLKKCQHKILFKNLFTGSVRPIDRELFAGLYEIWNEGKSGRPLYPILMQYYHGAEVDVHAMSKSLRTTDSCDKHLPSKYAYLLANTCTSSCYTPDQKLLFKEGEVEIVNAYNQWIPDIITLSNDASLEHIDLIDRPVYSYTGSVEATTHDILVIKTKNGELKVTPNHPLILSTGFVVAAESLKVGDELISQHGNFDPIVSIDKTKFQGKVYNVKPDSRNEDGSLSLNGQIVIAQGYLSGSSYLQNGGNKYIDKYIMRGTVPESLLDFEYTTIDSLID